MTDSERLAADLTWFAVQFCADPNAASLGLGATKIDCSDPP
jgi:hypothetical protein